MCPTTPPQVAESRACIPTLLDDESTSELEPADAEPRLQPQGPSGTASGRGVDPQQRSGSSGAMSPSPGVGTVPKRGSTVQAISSVSSGPLNTRDRRQQSRAARRTSPDSSPLLPSPSSPSPQRPPRTLARMAPRRRLWFPSPPKHSTSPPQASLPRHQPCLGRPHRRRLRHPHHRRPHRPSPKTRSRAPGLMLFSCPW
jgi:hypothetical protein